MRSMRARRFSRHTSVRLDNYFHIDRSNFFLVTTSLPGTTVDPFPKNRAQRSIGLLSVLAHWYAKHLMLCTRFACCADRWFSRRPNLEIGVRVLHPALVRAPCLGVCRLALSGSLHQTVRVLSVAPSGITPYST